MRLRDLIPVKYVDEVPRWMAGNRRPYASHFLVVRVRHDAPPFTVEQELYEARFDWLALFFGLLGLFASPWFLLALLVYPLSMWPKMPRPWSYVRAWVEIRGHGAQYAAQAKRLMSLGVLKSRPARPFRREAEMRRKIKTRARFMVRYYRLPYTAGEIESRIWAIVNKELEGMG